MGLLSSCRRNRRVSIYVRLEADIFHFRLHLLNAFIADLNDPSGGHKNILVSYLQKQPSELHSVKEYQV